MIDHVHPQHSNDLQLIAPGQVMKDGSFFETLDPPPPFCGFPPHNCKFLNRDLPFMATYKFSQTPLPLWVSTTQSKIISKQRFIFKLTTFLFVGDDGCVFLAVKPDVLDVSSARTPLALEIHLDVFAINRWRDVHHDYHVVMGTLSSCCRWFEQCDSKRLSADFMPSFANSPCHCVNRNSTEVEEGC